MPYLDSKDTSGDVGQVGGLACLSVEPATDRINVNTVTNKGFLGPFRGMRSDNCQNGGEVTRDGTVLTRNAQWLPFPCWRNRSISPSFKGLQLYRSALRLAR